MLQIDKAIISFDVLEKKFSCQLEKCRGACCVVGQSGAPLDEEELLIMDDIFPLIRNYLKPEGLKAIEQQGIYIVDGDGDYVTPLINNGECAYSYPEKGITFCAIEKAFLKNEIEFRKPISCHLYPIRITHYSEHDAVNYDHNELCHDAICQGLRQKIAVYQFLKEPLIRKYGMEWYQQLEYAAKNIPDNYFSRESS